MCKWTIIFLFDREQVFNYHTGLLTYYWRTNKASTTFESRSASRFHGSSCDAGLFSISHFTNLLQIFTIPLHSICISLFMCAWSWSEAGDLSPFILPTSHFISQADQIPSPISFWAEDLDLSEDNLCGVLGHIHLFTVNPLMSQFICHKYSCIHMPWEWTTPQFSDFQKDM